MKKLSTLVVALVLSSVAYSQPSNIWGMPEGTWLGSSDFCQNIQRDSYSCSFNNSAWKNMDTKCYDGIVSVKISNSWKQLKDLHTKKGYSNSSKITSEFNGKGKTDNKNVRCVFTSIGS